MATQGTTESLVETLRGTDCQYENCAGTLHSDSFRGDEALVCDDCGTPVVRLW